MKTVEIQSVIRRTLCLVSALLLAGGLVVAQQPAPPAQAPAPALAPEQLDTLVAPIALYPDALLSQVLVASTYPLEITEAAQWLQQNRNLQGSQLVDAARQQNWDPSIQALVVFPDVIGSLSNDIRWTTDLGNAFLAQQADVMNAVQRMRAEAMQAGKLRSNEQQTVTTDRQGDQSVIEIQPADPQVVYVPQYNPEYIWGPPAYGYYPAWDYAYFGAGFGFGPGIYIGSFFGGLGWGGWGWGPNWFGCSIFQNPFFFSHYGFGGHGFRGGVWAHNPGHRMGVPYSNGALAHRFGASGDRFGGGRSFSAQRSNAAQGGGWNRFGGTQRGSSSGYRAGSSYGNRSAYQAGSSYRSSPSNGNRGAYRASPSYGGGNRAVTGDRSSPSYGGNRSAYRASPSYGGGNRATTSYRSSPSYGGNRSAYRATPSYGGGYRASPSVRSSPSYGGGSRGAYRATPSYGGGYRASPSVRSSPSYGGGSRGAYRASPSYGGGNGGGRSMSSSRSSGGGGGGSSHSSGGSRGDGHRGR